MPTKGTIIALLRRVPNLADTMKCGWGVCGGGGLKYADLMADKWHTMCSTMCVDLSIGKSTEGWRHGRPARLHFSHGMPFLHIAKKGPGWTDVDLYSR